ncbi:MAG: acyl-CoA/acyl-ACP dehydrogenase, partial [Actinobacteria bacterium]|nr:acyl-CoA/acyl-ACP dehydrogenase [Actinomycetota bacterium]
FVSRHAPGVEVVTTWDAHGMRATESHDTVLDGVFVADADVLAVVPAGPSDDPAIGAMAVWALTLISNVYVGIAERALELTIEHCRRATSIAIPAGTTAHHPLVQQRVAEMHLELAAARAQLDRLASDWVCGADHGPAWPIHVFAAKWRAATAAMRVVDLACDVVGGASFRRGHELERLARDVRAARFHPGTDAFAHEAIGKALLGIEAAGPRCGGRSEVAHCERAEGHQC